MYIWVYMHFWIWYQYDILLFFLGWSFSNDPLRVSPTPPWPPIVPEYSLLLYHICYFFATSPRRQTAGTLHDHLKTVWHNTPNVHYLSKIQSRRTATSHVAINLPVHSSIPTSVYALHFRWGLLPSTWRLVHVYNSEVHHTRSTATSNCHKTAVPSMTTTTTTTPKYRLNSDSEVSISLPSRCSVHQLKVIAV